MVGICAPRKPNHSTRLVRACNVPSTAKTTKEDIMSKTAQTDQEQHLYAMRHSLAHIMATAIQELYPDVKFGIGPVVENGFYYDVDLSQNLSEADLAKIESKMHEVI